MVRTIGILAAFVFLVVLAGGAVPSHSYADVTPAVSADVDDSVMMGDEGEKDKSRKKPKPRKYAEKLKRKIQKPPPPPPKPKYKKWGEVLKDAKDHDGLIKVWTKQEDVYFEIKKDQLDGLEMNFGNADAMLALLKKMCTFEGVGEILTKGFKTAIEHFAKIE